jgi:SAM-dependent methyltransferase
MSAAGTDDWESHWKTYAASNNANPAQAYRRMLVWDALALGAAAGPVRLLEIGSGPGDLARDVLAARPDAEVVGMDLAASAVALAQSKVPGAAFFQQDLTRPMALPARYRGWATHVVCSEVLEHLDDPGAALRNVRPLLAPGCKIVVTVPAGPMSAFDKHIGHRGHFSDARLRATLEGAGLEVADLRGAGFPFFNVYRLVVIARGRKLIDDASGDGGRPLPLAARAMIRLFSSLFRLNRQDGRRGWQLVAVAVEPRAAGAGGGGI